MKILGLSGGTPNGANDALCKEALMAAKEQGAEIEFINLNTLDLKPCTGCKACAIICSCVSISCWAISRRISS